MDWLRSEDLKEEKVVTTSSCSLTCAVATCSLQINRESFESSLPVCLLADIKQLFIYRTAAGLVNLLHRSYVKCANGSLANLTNFRNSAPLGA